MQPQSSQRLALAGGPLPHGRLGGRELATRLLQQRPELRVTYMSGNAEEECNEGDGYLAKPFSIDGLLREVARCMQGTERT